MNKNRIFIAIGVAVLLIIACAAGIYAAWPSIMYSVSPDKYVSYAIKNTMKDLTVLDNAKKSSELLSNIYVSPSTYNFGASLNNIDISGFDGTEILSGVGFDASVIVDRDKALAGLDLKIKKSSTPVISAKGFVSNNDFGGIVPELYSKYIVADTKDFAYNWNNSILGGYFEIDERIDIADMYDIIFPKPAASEEKLLYEKIYETALTYTDKLSYDAKGNVELTYNGQPQKLSRIDITLNKDDAKQFVNKISKMFEFDGALAGVLLQGAGDYIDTDTVYGTLENVTSYFENSKLNKDLVFEMYFYKNKIAKININAEIIGVENLVLSLSTGIELVDRVVNGVSEFKVFIPSEPDIICAINGDWSLSSDRSDSHMTLNMDIKHQEDFDAVINMECVYGFDEKNVLVYTNINKLKLDINYAEENILADAKINFASQAGTGSGVTLPKDSVNITEAGYSELLEIYTELFSNLGEIAKLVNLGGMF